VAPQLERERWYVGTAVPEGGVGGLLGVELLDVGVAAPKACKCFEILCHVGDEAFSVLIVGVVWRSSPGGLSCSSLERPVFAPPIALTASSLWLGWMSSHLGWVAFGLGCGCVHVGFALVVSVLAGFPLINWALFSISGKAKLLPRLC
jgi:hypothetical protein